ncbi:DUF1592 domain-containing protein [Nannocystis radixulma]|uniref:DUF1592 domain-containing protein n=1 Tax=Nannocystis radixulma TaxID=2995305 RepID=A0ABT5B7T6_9BACT|nr:DUF1592 domain-containing protein [Nannocystis radixulma]MDC0670157.1 DUF1592 domain-containing protein [Nannocystis radixulma]
MIDRRQARAWMLGSAVVLACNGGGGGGNGTDDPTATAGPSTDSDTDATTLPTTSEGTGVDPTEGAPAECGAPLDPGPAPLRRLTHTQYNNTVRDLFPGVTLPPQTIAVDPKVNGFENNADVQTPSALLIEQYQRAALAVTEAAWATPEAFLPCAADGGGEPQQCGHTFLLDLGARAFRRPLTADEEAAFLGFFDQQLAETNFSVALQLTTQALLQSPAFLYFLEFGGAPVEGGAAVALSGHELASRLSYFLWDSMPDAQLFAAAAAGDLDTGEGLVAEATRMLEDGKARGALVNFHRQWFDFDGVALINPDADTYPTYTPDLRAAMRAELDHFVEATLFEGPGTFASLLTATETEVDATLAALYGVDPPPPGEWAPVSLDPAQRSGILTRAGFLARTAHAVHPSPVKRGVFVLARLLCVPPAPPPANVNTNPPDEGEPGQPKTNRERYAKHTAQADCASCHTTIDGVGFGFEHYDALGRWRDLDNGEPVDASGELIGTDIDGTFDGAIELSEKLATSTQAHDCVVSQVYRYALGRGTGAADLCSLDDLRAQFAEASGDMRALLLAVVASDAFRTRREAP